jgi:hypothetical protein
MKPAQCLAVLLGCLLVLAAPLEGVTGGTSAVMPVSAQVLPSASVSLQATTAADPEVTRTPRFEGMPTQMVVTARDIVRGYIDVQGASLLRLSATLRPDIVVEFSPDAGSIRAVEMRTDAGAELAPAVSRADEAGVKAALERASAIAFTYRLNIPGGQMPANAVPILLTVNL